MSPTTLDAREQIRPQCAQLEVGHLTVGSRKSWPLTTASVSLALLAGFRRFRSQTRTQQPCIMRLNGRIMPAFQDILVEFARLMRKPWRSHPSWSWCCGEPTAGSGILRCGRPNGPLINPARSYRGGHTGGRVDSTPTDARWSSDHDSPGSRPSCGRRCATSAHVCSLSIVRSR